MQTLQHILITGAASGIGKACAIQLASQGHHVIATGKTLESLSNLRQLATEQNLPIRFAKLDLTSAEDIAAAKKYEIDTLINNGAIGESGPLVDIPLQRVRRNFETNVFGTLQLTQVLAEQMLHRKNGRIIIIGSTAGLITLPYLGSYNMTKYALEAAADALRMELANHGISVSLIEPGKIDTGFNQRMSSTKYQWLQNSKYFEQYTSTMQAADASFFNNEYAPKLVVNDIVHAVESTKPKARYISPRRIAWQIYVSRILPSRWRDRIMKKMLNVH